MRDDGRSAAADNWWRSVLQTSPGYKVADSDRRLYSTLHHPQHLKSLANKYDPKNCLCFSVWILLVQDDIQPLTVECRFNALRAKVLE